MRNVFQVFVRITCSDYSSFLYLCTIKDKLNTYLYIMTVLIGLAVLAVVALIGWMIAEGKEKAFKYHQSEDESAALQNTRDAQKAADYEEMNIKDVIKTISTKGFDAN